MTHSCLRKAARGPLAVWLLSLGCQHTSGSPESAAEPPPPVRVPRTLAPRPVIAPEPREFCEDSVYGRYLIERYHESNNTARTLQRIRQAGRRGRKRRFLTTKAVHHARMRFVGPGAHYGAIPMDAHHRVDFWIRYYQTRGRQTFLRWLVRSQSARPWLMPLLENEEMPPELFYLAMVESGFSNRAYSRARAAGMWQFIRSTAEHYGLQINYWVDERRDPVKATLAAMRFLRRLHDRFGSWYLAMAAYNAGPGRVRRAIRRTGSKSFWRLASTSHLRLETRNYVPKVIAAHAIGSNPAAFGFQVWPDRQNHLPASFVSVPRPVRLRELARRMGIGWRTLRRWNPELIRNTVPPTAGQGYRLRVTPTLAQTFPRIEDRVAYLNIRDIRMHTVRAGETLSAIAHQHAIPLHRLRAANPNIRPRALRIGQKLVVPLPIAVSQTDATLSPGRG